MHFWNSRVSRALDDMKLEEWERTAKEDEEDMVMERFSLDKEERAEIERLRR